MEDSTQKTDESGQVRTEPATVTSQPDVPSATEVQPAQKKRSILLTILIIIILIGAGAYYGLNYLKKGEESLEATKSNDQIVEQEEFESTTKEEAPKSPKIPKPSESEPILSTLIIADNILKDHPEYERVDSFIEGVAVVKDIEGNLFHVDTNGDRLYKENYRVVSGFSEGKAGVYDNKGNAFHINIKGDRIYKENYSIAHPFQEGKAAVKDKNQNFFHIDVNGNRLYEENYSSVRNFSEGRASVMDNEGNSFYIDEQGKRINEDNYANTGPFSEGLAAAQEKESKTWHYIDLDGNKKCGNYLTATPFKFGRAGVKAEGENGPVWFHINKECEPAYAERYSYRVGAYLETKLATVANQVGENYLIDMEGNRVSNNTFMGISSCSDRSMTATDINRNHFLIGLNGERLHKENYQLLFRCEEGIASNYDMERNRVYLDYDGNPIK